jgi:hypothetical protein
MPVFRGCRDGQAAVVAGNREGHAEALLEELASELHRVINLPDQEGMVQVVHGEILGD